MSHLLLVQISQSMDQTESDTGYTEEMLDSSGTTTGENTSMMIVGALREESLVGVKETNWTADGSKVCDLCGKSFARHALMMNHRRVHTGEKPFLCDVCEQRFREKSHLIRHMRVHRTERPFTCDVDDCNKTFTDKYYLAQHKLTHSDSKRLLCSSCGYRCSQVLYPE